MLEVVEAAVVLKPVDRALQAEQAVAAEVQALITIQVLQDLQDNQTLVEVEAVL
jgi:hypothetical protein